MLKRGKKTAAPDLTEFTDADGKKWVQTSTDDLFSLRELNDVLESIEKEREKSEVVLARIDFQRVDREYYERAMELQQKLNKQAEMLRKVAAEAKTTIEKKNRKLKELIDYIKKLHQFIAYLNENADELDEVPIPVTFQAAAGEYEPVEESVYEDVEEVIVSD